MSDLTKDVMCRLAASSDQKALEELQWRASLANDDDRAALLANPDAIELPLHQIMAGQVFVAERAGLTLGFAAILPREDGATELDGLFVEPAVWKQGIGRILVERCAEAARAQGSDTLHVVANPEAERFYLACGFERIGTVPTRFRPGFSMRRRLSSGASASQSEDTLPG
jgi:N-acetylglutamate synthase-like GNAT family acetyltransferase